MIVNPTLCARSMNESQEFNLGQVFPELYQPWRTASACCGRGGHTCRCALCLLATYPCCLYTCCARSLTDLQGFSLWQVFPELYHAGHGGEQHPRAAPVAALPAAALHLCLPALRGAPERLPDGAQPPRLGRAAGGDVSKTPDTLDRVLQAIEVRARDKP